MKPISRQNVEHTYGHYARFYDLVFGAVLQGGRRRMCEAVRVGNTVYLSGQLGNVPGPGPIKLAPGGMAGEAKQVMDNIQTALQAHGLSMADVVKCTVMLADMSEWGAFNDVYKTYFSGNFPARSAFGSNGLAFNARVEVECIAAWRK